MTTRAYAMFFLLRAFAVSFCVFNSQNRSDLLFVTAGQVRTFWPTRTVPPVIPDYSGVLSEQSFRSSMLFPATMAVLNHLRTRHCLGGERLSSRAAACVYKAMCMADKPVGDRNAEEWNKAVSLMFYNAFLQGMPCRHSRSTAPTKPGAC